MKKKLKSLFYIFFPIIIGSIVGFIIKDYIDYSKLNKPPLSPPKILFPIMWSIIYLLMGVSYYLFKKNYNFSSKGISKLYYIQLFVNALWSIIFFVFKLRFLSIIWILLLLILIITLYKSIIDKVKVSAYLLILYILWTMFATYLNIGIYIY